MKKLYTVIIAVFVIIGVSIVITVTLHSLREPEEPVEKPNIPEEPTPEPEKPKPDFYFKEIYEEGKQYKNIPVKNTYYVKECDAKEVSQIVDLSLLTQKEQEAIKTCFMRKTYVNDIEVKELEEIYFYSAEDITTEENTITRLKELIASDEIHRDSIALSNSKETYFLFKSYPLKYIDEDSHYVITDINGKIIKEFEVYEDLDVYILTDNCTDKRCDYMKIEPTCDDRYHNALYGNKGNLIPISNSVYYLKRENFLDIIEYRITVSNNLVTEEKLNTYQMDYRNVFSGKC